MTKDSIRELKSIAEVIENTLCALENPLCLDVTCPECDHEFNDECHDGCDMTSLDSIRSEIVAILERETGKDIQLL